jgi:hypothetical protein
MAKTQPEVKKIVDPFQALEEISDLGKAEEIVEVSEKFKILISTISSEEEAEVFTNCSQFEGMNYLTRSKIETLAFAIKGVNGEKFEYDKIIDLSERKKVRDETVGKVRELIGKWRDEIVTFLYEKFLKLTGNSEEQMKKLGLMSIASKQVKNKLDEMALDLEEKK